MLELRRLRLLRELRERGTIAAVADALQFTPSAVSQQLSILERESGVRLLEKAGRGVRLTDAALVLVAHAEVLLERAALAEADLAAAAGTVAGRVHGALDALPAGLVPDQLHTRVRHERGEDPHRVGAAADAGRHRVRQPAGQLQQLRPGLVADHPL